MSAAMLFCRWSRDHGIGAQWALLSFLLLLAVLSAGPVLAAEGDPAGRATITLGTVEAIAADGTVRRLGRQDPVFEGDTLRTGPRGRAQIRFTDRGLLSLRPDTEVAIDDYEFDRASPSSGSQEMSLARGGFRTRTGSIAEDNRDAYRVRTPLAVIGVRGTVWEAFQEVGGPLTLGAARGAIRAVSNSGQDAVLGENQDYDYARVDPDGSIEFLVAPPGALDSSPDLDQPSDEEGSDGGDAGGLEDSTVATGGGDAESTAGAVSEGGGDVVSTLGNPEDTGAVSESNTGDGDLPTEEEIVIGPLLSAAEREALIGGDGIAIVTGLSSDAVDTEGARQLDGFRVESALAARDDVGDPLIAMVRDGIADFPPGSETTDRATLLDGSDLLLTGDSGTISGLFQPAGGDAGLTWGRFEQPARLFTDPTDGTMLIETAGAAPIPFVLGAPTDIADRTGQRFYELQEFDVVTASGLTVTEVFADAFLDLDSGGLEGILDVALADAAEPGTPLFTWVVDYGATVRGGLLQDTQVPFAALVEETSGESLDAEAEISGFLTGAEAEFLQLGFSYSTPSDANLDTAGLVLLQSGLTPPNALTAEEALALDQGFGYVSVQCCFLDPVVATPAGRITDPAASSGADTLAGVPLDETGVPLSVLAAAFTDFPPDALLRRQDASVADFASIAAGTNAAISRFRWEGSTETPVGLFDAQTGELLREVDTDLLVLAGRLADVADLTGFRRFSTDTLQAGRLVSESGAFAPRPLESADISFNVDFASGDLVDGIARIHTDPDDVEQPFRDGFFAFFGGTVGSENGSPQASLSLLGGVYEDQDGDAGNFGQVDLERSRMDGFFAGDGDAFNLSFALVSEAAEGGRETGGEVDATPDQGGTGPHEPVSAIGLAVLEEELLQLSAAEQTAFEQGIAFVGAECCVDAGTAAGPVAVDGLPRPVPGLNTDGTEDLSPSQAGFLDPSPEQLVRIGGAEENLTGFLLPPPGTIDGHQQIEWFRLFSPSLVVDADSGDITQRLDRQVLFQTAMPADLANLSGFRTYSGSLTTENIGGGAFLSTGGAGRFGVSFSVDLDTGEIEAGHLTVENFEDAYFEALFDGQVALANGNPFAELEIEGGSFDGTIPLDLESSELEGFFTAPDGLFAGSFYLVTNEEVPTATSGIYSIGEQVEERLAFADVQAASRVGIMAFPNRDSDGLLPNPGSLEPGIVPGLGNLVLGRGTEVDPDSPAPGFTLLANPLRQPGPDGDVGPGRADFLRQPVEFVVRDAAAPAATDPALFSADARPLGATNYAGFEVTWGAWDGGVGQDVEVQDNPANAGSVAEISNRVFFGSVNPTPTSQLPASGVFSFTGSTLEGLGIAYVGEGAGDLSLSFAGAPIDDMGVSFDVDFGNGAISNGDVLVAYEGDTPVEWQGTFDGRIQGSRVEMNLQSLDILQQGSGAVLGEGDLSRSSMTGTFTGPEGERFFGGFSFDGGDPVLDPPLLEAVRGLFVIDRQ